MKPTVAFGMILFTALFVGRGHLPQRSAAGSKTAQRKNRTPTIESFTATPVMDSGLCPWATSSCGDEVILALAVKAGDPDDDTLSYHYITSGGVIRGVGPDVSWELNKAGAFSATVEVTDGKGGKASASVAYVIHLCTSCDHPPPCPTVNLSCPDTAVEGEQVILRRLFPELKNSRI